jgi:hypothetical protein
MKLNTHPLWIPALLLIVFTLGIAASTLPGYAALPGVALTAVPLAAILFSLRRRG